jgi:hypothetical protein
MLANQHTTSPSMFAPGHCCAFCSYGDVSCPPFQENADGISCCGPDPLDTCRHFAGPGRDHSAEPDGSAEELSNNIKQAKNQWKN